MNQSISTPETGISFLGLDGCRAGWACVRLDARGRFENFSVLSSLDELRQEARPGRVWIDIPVGLLDRGPDERSCDLEARRFLSARKSSVFRVPVRAAVHSNGYRQACRVNKSRCGVGLSLQTWNIVPRIREADRFLSSHPEWQPLFFESHPELCFQSLNRQKPLLYPKKIPAGLRERKNILRRHFPDISKCFLRIRGRFKKNRLADDDILDAFALAVSAHRSETAGFTSLPERPDRDASGLPMRIVFPGNQEAS